MFGCGLLTARSVGAVYLCGASMVCLFTPALLVGACFQGENLGRRSCNSGVISVVPLPRGVVFGSYGWIDAPWSPLFWGTVFFPLYLVTSCGPRDCRLPSKETSSTLVFASFRSPRSGCLGRHRLTDALPLSPPWRMLCHQFCFLLWWMLCRRSCFLLWRKLCCPSCFLVWRMLYRPSCFTEH